MFGYRKYKKYTAVLFYFLKDCGFNEDSKPITFDKDKLNSEKKNIQFLFGQLESIHKNAYELTPKATAIKYTGQPWTTDNAILMEFLHLASSSNLISSFIAETKSAAILKYEPTLSPRDPNFDSWYEGYKAQMNKTQRAPGGSEPGE